MLYRKEANSRDRKSNIEKGEGGSIVEIRKEICLKHSNMTKCFNTFVPIAGPRLSVGNQSVLEKYATETNYAHQANEDYNAKDISRRGP